MNLPIADYTIIYNQKDISTDISATILSIDYTDKVSGESDELELTMEDANSYWLNAWYPTKGDTLQLFIRVGGQELNCGTFQIDELSSRGSIGGATFTIKGLATGVTQKLRTKNSRAHSNKTLQQIAETVAADMKLKVLGTIENIPIRVANQYRETNLQFLNRLGSSYGYQFSVKGNQLVFVHYSDIENKGAALILSITDLISFDIKDTTNKTFKTGRNRHHDPLNKELIEDSEDTENDPDYEGFDGVSDDDNETHERVENQQQSKAKVKFGIHDKNSKAVEGEISLPGNLLLVSGNNIQLSDIGKLSGTYHIFEAKHTISRDRSYGTSVQIKRIKK